jgi:hypothetical protein
MLAMQKIEMPRYLTLFSPALDWLLQCIANKSKILEFRFCWPLSVECISVIVRTYYYSKFSAKSIQRKKTASKLDEK